ncbi:MAG TPA: ImmA/IrrE family metallo-endopeptidase [Candidatus Limnocylindrales bacterium]|nr:ImmA/IrrE family metallo-endopeptidase [Candidatus Limnocylindrales bacterium]
MARPREVRAARENHVFVLHHESQHFIKLEAQSAGDPPGYDWHKEREANTFAAELLMPPDSVRPDAKASLNRLATAKNDGLSPLQPSAGDPIDQAFRPSVYEKADNAE